MEEQHRQLQQCNTRANKAVCENWQQNKTTIKPVNDGRPPVAPAFFSITAYKKVIKIKLVIFYNLNVRKAKVRFSFSNKWRILFLL